MEEIQGFDLSVQVFGKYQHSTGYNGVWYSDEDFGFWSGRPVWGAIPAPDQWETRPFNPIAELWRKHTRKRSY